MLPWVGAANIGIDYKHVFFGNHNVSPERLPPFK